ncbi:sugar ABC transporter substrate-binding protein [Paenibacillus dendritiformis]|nr:extracellular solute-binding protein [Paenibacillus dendritiformis]MBG9794996.1 sugar ABC transporter substrate-binding protein [Paenibacillus dendritiformis]
MMRRGKLAIVMLVLLSLLGGCLGQKPVLEELGKDGSGKIKIMYDSEEAFYNDYGNQFLIKYPNIKFEVVSTGEIDEEQKAKGISYQEALLHFVQKHMPDVIIANPSTHEALVQEGKLYNLEAIISQERFELEGYMPGLLEMLRELGGGSLYGLAPYFYASIIFYNADLFREHGIELPRNKMTWKETLELAERFAGIGSGENQIYGFTETIGSGHNLLFKIAETLSQCVLDSRGEKVTFETKGWKEALELTAHANRSKAAYTMPLEPEGEGPIALEQGELFFSGKAAMVMASFWFEPSFRYRFANDKESSAFDWGMVTVPIDPSFPDETPHTSMPEIFGITADSPNKRAAWEFVKYVNGPEMERAASRTPGGKLSTRVNFIKEIDGKSVEPLYMLKPKVTSRTVWGGEKGGFPYPFYAAMTNLITRELKAMVENGKSAEEAAAAIQREGEAALKQARETEKAKREAEKK